MILPSLLKTAAQPPAPTWQPLTWSWNIKSVPPILGDLSRSFNSRVVRLEGATRHGKVGYGGRGLEGAGARLQEGVLHGGLVDEIADPGVPAGLDLAGVIVVLGVLDPASAQGKFLVVLEEFVAGAVGANEGTCLGVAYEG